jgi:hypothetical protein
VTKALRKASPAAPAPRPRWQIESGTRGVYVGSTYAERTTNWPLFTWSPDPARIIRFDDREAAEAERARVPAVRRISTDIRSGPGIGHWDFRHYPLEVLRALPGGSRVATAT